MTNLVTCSAFLAMNEAAGDGGVDLKFHWDNDSGFSVMVDIDPQLDLEDRPDKPTRFYRLSAQEVRNVGRTLLMLADMHDGEKV